MSGHSKWATIKRKKGANDAARGKLFTKLIREIVISARQGGGDISGNPRLRKAVMDAKGNQMPNDTITRAMKRGTGEIEGATYEEVLYEGTGPAGTLFLVEGSTDNRNRTAAELRKLFDRNNGAMGGTGTAAWAFERRGAISVKKENLSEEQMMEWAVAAGAEDYVAEDSEWLIYTPVTELDTVTQALEGAQVEVLASKCVYVPKSKKAVTGRDAEVCLNLAEGLDDHDDVANVYADFDVSEEELQRIAAST